MALRIIEMTTIRQMDAVEGLLSLAKDSVDLLLSDLPSGETAAQFDVSPPLDLLWEGIWHAVKPDGIVVLMASSFRFASALRDSQEKFFRYDRVWEKSLPTGFYNAKSRPLRSHEFVLVFWRYPGTYNPQMWNSDRPISANRRKGRGELKPSHGVNYGPSRKSSKSRAGALDRYPTSMLHYGGVGTASRSRVHPQQKPVSLFQDLVRTYSNVGELVCDPYAGSGTTGKASLSEGRRFVGFENCAEFVSAANSRLNHRSLFE